MMSFMDPKSDTGFKKLFGNEDHTDIITSFLNTMLKRSGKDEIQTISFAKTENLRHPIEGKQTLLDMHAIDGHGHHYIIEMSSYAKAPADTQLKGIYQLKFPLILIKQSVKKNHVSAGAQRAQEETFHYIELPKFKKTIEECETLEDKWLFFMQQAEKCRDIPEKISETKELVTAFNLLERMSWTHSDMADYIREQDSAGHEQRVIEGAKERGREEGREEGALAKAEAMAIKLLKKDTKISEISELTELSIDHINALCKKKN